MEVHRRCRVRIRAGGRDVLVVRLPLDLELTALPCEDLGARAGEGIGRAGGKLGAVLLSRAGEEFDGEGSGVGGLEAEFVAGDEVDAARGGRFYLGKVVSESWSEGLPCGRMGETGKFYLSWDLSQAGDRHGHHICLGCEKQLMWEIVVGTTC